MGEAVPCLAEARLTGITVFSIHPLGGYNAVNGWDTLPTNAVPNAWVWTSGGDLLNGPSDTAAALNSPLEPSPTLQTINVTAAPGSLFEPYHGINLFFNGSTSPQISAYQPTACGAGPPLSYGDSSLGLGGEVTAAGSLRCVAGGREIELVGYLWSQPDCAPLDDVSPFAWSPDGTNDFHGGFALMAREVPRLSISATTTNSIHLSWTVTAVSATGYGLERSLTLSPASWSSVTNTPTDDAGYKTVTLPVLPEPEFFRLHKP
jgi:hypothetical protein